MTRTLTLRGDFRDPDADGLCAELEEISLWTPGEQTHVDLRQLGVLSSRALAILLASLHGLCRRRICDPFHDLIPPESGRYSCLERQALGGLLVYGAGQWQPTPGPTPTILGCEMFVTTTALDGVIASVVNRLAKHSNWPIASLSSVGTMILELGENVIQHAHADGGIVVIEICPDDERVSIAIADNGVGVRASLTKNLIFESIADDRTAIATAMAPGRTGEAGTGGGMGLYLTRLVVRRAAGAFTVRSGDSCREETSSVKDSNRLARLNGTLIAIETSTANALDYDLIDTSLMQPSGIES